MKWNKFLGVRNQKSDTFLFVLWFFFFVLIQKWNMFALFLLAYLAIWVIMKHLLHLYRLESYVKHLKSTHPLLPFLGTIYGMIGKSLTEVFNEFLQFSKINKTPIKTYFGSTLIVTLDHPEDIKTICTSPYCYDKPFVFDFFPHRAGIFTARCKF